jgi:16S rRNA (uracil1498-N3)-methyltransferase
MRDHRHFLFFSDSIEDNRLFLDPAESHHAVSVLRLETGSMFFATNGRGALFECRCESISKKGVSAAILARLSRPRHGCSLHCLVGIPERGAFESLLVNCAALGVTRITPVIFKHCQTPWWNRSWEALEARFFAKMITAIKQAQYPWLPHLDAPMSPDRAFEKIKGFCLVADPDGVPFAGVIPTLQEQIPPFFAIIGPPGGLTGEETADIKARGSLFASIAPTRLTTELAAVVLAGEVIGTYLTSRMPSPSHGAAA